VSLPHVAEVLPGPHQRQDGHASPMHPDLGPAHLPEEHDPATARSAGAGPETEYLRAGTAAELTWVRGVVDDLRTGALAWSQEELAGMARSFLPE